MSAPVAEVLSDFELVRNAVGEWLLVLPELPGENTLCQLVWQQGELRLRRGERVWWLSPPAGSAFTRLRADQPTHILVCEVDDEGIERRHYHAAITTEL